MSQAAVSRIIANLEMETHLILFVRKVRGAIPTPAGRILYKEWKEAMREFETGYIRAYRAQLGYIKDLNIGCIDMNQELSHHIKLLDWFEKTFPGNVLRVEYDIAEILREGLVSRKFDVLFINYFEAAYLESIGICCRIMVERNCNLFIHKSNPLYNKESISGDDLKGRKITFLGSCNILSSSHLQKFCGIYGVDVSDICLEEDYNKMVISFVRETGICFSEGIFEQNQLKDARRFPLKGIASGLAVAWMKENNTLPIREIIQYTRMAEQELHRK